MATRNQNILALSRLSAVLLLVLLVLVNISAARSSVRVDLTEEGLYTLTDASQAVLRGLDDPATIKVFWHNVPERWETERRFVESLLREMKTSAGGNLTLRWVDLESDDGQQEADDAGVQPRRFEVYEEGEARAAAGYDSLLVQVGDETETVDGLATLGPRFEYEVVSRLNKMTRTDEVVVGLVAPRPAMNPFAGAQGGRFNGLEGMIREEYGAGFRSQVNLAEPIPEDVKVLVVVAPEDLEPKAVFHLEQFLLRGGRVLLMLDPVHAPLGQAPSSRPTSAGIEEWLAHQGITLQPGVVGDIGALQKRPRAVRTRIGQVVEWILYPYWPLLRADNMDAANPATRGFDQIPLYWPAALSVDEAKQKDAGREATILATTTEGGWPRQDLIGLDNAEDDFRGLSRDDLDRDAKPHIPLMVLLDGTFTSFWKGRPAPGEEEKKDVEDGAEKPDGEPEGEPDETPSGGSEAGSGNGADGEAEDTGPSRLETGAGLLFVMTDAELVDDDVSRLTRGLGFHFAMNLLDWMSGSDDLLQLRARTQKPRTLDPVEPKEQKLVQWINILGIPLLVLFTGIVVFIVRRYRS